MAFGLVLPEVPPMVLVRTWVAEVVRHANGTPIEEALASHGHILVRRAVTWWWRAWPAVQAAGPERARSRHADGGSPTKRLNARLNAASEP